MWAGANKRLDAEKPDVEREIEKVDVQVNRTRKTIDRYFKAFEAGTMKAGLCSEKVEDLNARVK